MLSAINQKLFASLLLIVSLYSPFHVEEVDLLSTKNKNEYKAITYNIHGGLTKSGTPSLNEITDLLQKEDADFIALQEVDKYNSRSNYQDQIRRLGKALDMEYVFGSNINLIMTEYGNAILSKYPILDWGKIELAYENEPRSMLWAKVKTNDGILYVTSVHLGLDKEKRTEHFGIIEDFVNSIDEPVIVMGDFNSLPDNQSFSQFRSRVTGKLHFEDVPTYIKNQPIQIDYIFGKGINEIETYNIPSNASDHYPLITKFRISSHTSKGHYLTMI